MPYQARTVSGALKDCADFQHARNDLVNFGPFTCNACNGSVFVRGGIPGGKIRLHFVHQSLSPHCPSGLHRNVTSSESSVHARAKEMILNFKDQLIFVVQCECRHCDISEVTIAPAGMTAELEKSVDGMRYRFDLLFTNPSKPEQWFAVEVVHKNPVNAEKVREVNALGTPMYKRLEDGTTVASSLKLPRIIQVSAEDVLERLNGASACVEVTQSPKNNKKRPIEKKLKIYDMFCCQECNRCQRVLQQSTPLTKCIRTEQGITFPVLNKASLSDADGLDDGDDMHDALLRPGEDIAHTVPQYELNKKQILNCVEAGTLIKVQAIAGAGKSTVIKEYVRSRINDIRSDEDEISVLVLMYNKDPCNEMKRELGGLKRVNVQTIDSFLWNLKDDMVFWSDWELPDAPSHAPLCYDTKGHKGFDPISGLCVYCGPMIKKSLREFLWSSDHSAAPKHCEKNVKSKNQIKGILQCVHRVWGTICSSDYDESYTTEMVCKMIQTGVLKVDLLREYRFVIIDEAQDLTNAEGEIFLKRNPGITCICVGDEMQNINAFRGAGDCFQRVECDANIILPCTWRFSYPLTGFVEKICRQVAGIRDFLVWTGDTKKITSVIQTSHIVHFFDMIHRNPLPKNGVHCLFRYNADILLAIFDLVKAGRINENTRVNAPGLIGKMGDVSLSIANTLFTWHRLGYISNEEKRNLRPSANYSKSFNDYLGYVRRCKTQYGKYTDMYILLNFVMDADMTNIQTFQNQIDVLQKVIQKEGVCNYTFMTAHASKGYTFHTVYVDHGMTLFEKESIDRQGINLLYVALTRASHRAYIHDTVFRILEHS